MWLIQKEFFCQAFFFDSWLGDGLDLSRSLKREWGRNSFDGGIEAIFARRPRHHVVKRMANRLTGDVNYQLAA